VLTAFVRAFRTPDLRKKILFTLAIMALFRLGSVIPTPGVSYEAVRACTQGVEGNSLYALINLFSGGALLQLTIFALGIMPYITASIIVQLLTVVIPRFESLKKEGQSGTAKLTQYTRYLTVALAILQSTGLIAIARQPGQLFPNCRGHHPDDRPRRPDHGQDDRRHAVVMWLGELITDRGIGNGMSAADLHLDRRRSRLTVAIRPTEAGPSPSSWLLGSSSSRSSCSSSRRSAASRCSTPSG
jgi:preprotein translocase subunit SecY